MMIRKLYIKKLTAIFFVTFFISGCVTTQGIPKIPEIKEFKTFGANLTQMTDLLSAEIRQLKKLISEANSMKPKNFTLKI